MNAGRKTSITRLLLALGGVAVLGAPALAQPRNTLVRHGGPVYAEPIRFEREAPAATVWIDGRAHRLSECDGVRAGLIEALQCAGYDVWCEGYTIVVDISCHEPRLRWDSCDYRLTVREHCGELRLWVRPVHQHREVIHVPVEPRRDRYRVEEPVIVRPAPSVHVGVRYDDRRDRPGNREPARGRGPVYHEPPSYETQHFGIGFEFDDDDVRFSVDGGFFQATPRRGR